MEEGWARECWGKLDAHRCAAEGAEGAPGTNTRLPWIVSEQAQWLGEVPQQWSKANDTPVSRRRGMKMQGTTSQSVSP